MAIDWRGLATPRAALSIALILASVPVTVVCAFISFWQAGVGHGSYRATHIFFPYTIASVALFEGALGLNTGGLAFVVPMLVQFPLYAVILVLAWRKGRLIHALLALLAAHILVAAILWLI